MSEHAYTVKELDELRTCVYHRVLFGTCVFGSKSHCSRSFSPGEAEGVTEKRLRTHMLAGHVAQDLINADTLKIKGDPNCQQCQVALKNNLTPNHSLHSLTNS